MDQKTSNLTSLPESANKEFWEGSDMHTTYRPEGFSVEECRHHFVSMGGNIVQCRFCRFGGPLKVKKDSITLRNGKSYKVFAD